MRASFTCIDCSDGQSEVEIDQHICIDRSGGQSEVEIDQQPSLALA